MALRIGARGADVMQLQHDLTAAGFPVPIDGDFGPKTKAAVEAFQRSKGLQADGIVGPKTNEALAGAGTKATGGDADVTPTGGGLLSVEKLRSVMPNITLKKANLYIDPLNRAMAEFKITTRLRAAAFVAQLAHESVQLLYFEEIASGWAYDKSKNPKKAKNLGNTQAGDGPRYKGRGPIQLTGRANYRAAGKALGLDLEGQPTIAATPNVGFRIAGWFWTSRGLNALADQSNFREITRRINGGYNGYADRVQFYNRALKVL